MTTPQPLPPLSIDDWCWGNENTHTVIEMCLMQKYRCTYMQDGQGYYKFLDFISRNQPNLLTSALALLHSVFENKVATAEELRREWRVPENIIARIERMTSKEGQSYEEYIDGMLGDKITCNVMKKVLEFRMQMHRYRQLDEATLAQLQRFHAAYQKVRVVARD